MQNFSELMLGSNKKSHKQPSMSDFLGSNTKNKKVINPFGGGFDIELGINPSSNKKKEGN
ncbi:MAG: hypothetical protein V2A62_03465 [Candidatus Woesearchaeota archaeon]